MQRTILIIATLICGLALLCGCRGAGTSAPANERELTDHDAAARDAAVLQVVFDDMLSKENSEAPAEWNGDQSKHVYMSKNPCSGRVIDGSSAKGGDGSGGRSGRSRWQRRFTPGVKIHERTPEDLRRCGRGNATHAGESIRGRARELRIPPRLFQGRSIRGGKPRVSVERANAFG